MILNKTIRTETPNIQFYYEDIVTYIEKHVSVLDCKNESTENYKQLLQKDYKHYVIIANQYRTKTYHIIHGTKYGKIFSFNVVGLRATISFMQFYTMLQEQMITSMENSKTLKTMRHNRIIFALTSKELKNMKKLPKIL